VVSCVSNKKVGFKPFKSINTD